MCPNPTFCHFFAYFGPISGSAVFFCPAEGRVVLKPCPAETYTFLHFVFERKLHESAGNSGRASGLKNQQRKRTFTRALEIARKASCETDLDTTQSQGIFSNAMCMSKTLTLCTPNFKRRGFKHVDL